jgi:hypothetical protein
MMFPPETTYDQAARFLLRQGGGPLLAWLLDEPPEALRFRRWLDSVLTLPGTKERLCDAIARLETPDGEPLALLVEVQTRPDASMFGRLGVAGGILWETVRPDDLPGDRYGLMALVVNLTGGGSSGRTFRRVSSLWEISPCEWNLADEDAAQVMAGVATGTIPQEMLAFVPAMQNGGEAAIITTWLDLVRREPDPRRRGVLTLAVVFAGLTDCDDVWRKALEGFDVMESKIVNEWKAEAERKGERLAKVEMILRLVQKRYGEVPEELGKAIRACDDKAKFDAWLDATVTASSLDDFRRLAGP